MAHVFDKSLCDDDGTVLGTFKSHWQACAAMIRLSDPEFKSLGGDSPDALVLEAEIKKNLAGKEREGEKKISALRRFEEKFVPEPNSGCWLWIGAISPKGYGRFHCDGRNEKAYRFAYKAYVGEIPADLMVLHACDTRCCVNPAHLFLGTNNDNILDMIRKNRQSHGERRSVLTAKQVLEIKEIASQKALSHAAIARLYGVHKSTITHIINERIWGHLWKNFRHSRRRLAVPTPRQSKRTGVP